MIKGSVSHECSWALRIEHLGSKEAWKTSSVSGGSWYTQGCLLQQKPSILTKLKHVSQGIERIKANGESVYDDKGFPIIAIDKAKYKLGEEWTVLTSNGPKKTTVKGPAMGGDQMNGTYFAVELNESDYLMAVPSAHLTEALKYKPVKRIQNKDRLDEKQHQSLYQAVQKHINKVNQKKKMTNAKLSIYPYQLEESFPYLIYLHFEFPNVDDPRNNNIYQLFTYDPKTDEFITLKESDCDFDLSYLSDFDQNGFYEIATEEWCLESEANPELMYMNKLGVFSVEKYYQ